MSSREIPPSSSSKAESQRSRSPVPFPNAPQACAPPLSRLARQVVELAEMIPGVAGVRLWRTISGEAVVWHQAGTIPTVEGMPPPEPLMDGADPGARGSASWTRPLIRNEQVLGLLEVFGGSLAGAAESALEKLAEVAAAALSEEKEKETAKDLSAILEATKLLNSTIDLPELLDIILQLSTRLCRADRGTVFLVNREQNELWSLKGLGLERREIRLSIDQGIAGWVAREGRSVRVEDASRDPRFDPEVDRDLEYRTRELIALPIRNKENEIVAVLEVLNRQAGAFSAADENTLSHLCVHVAVALEKAQLHTAILAKQRMEHDLQLARDVQRGLLPEEPPEIEGLEIGVAYTPSLMVGGDYYDFMRLKPKSWLTVVADVEGKGVASALMMASLQACLRTVAAHVHALESVVKSVNDMVLSHIRTRKLLSMFAAVVDEPNRALHYINAGHVPPLVVRQNGDTVRLEEGGLVLGVFRDAPYKRGRVDFRPGDILAAYTDGVTEAMDIQGEQYGLERLADLIRRRRTEPVRQIVKTVLSEVGRFSAGGQNEDDRVMLVLRVD
jgi:phosphoserine phosphatase RsbU/P